MYVPDSSALVAGAEGFFNAELIGGLAWLGEVLEAQIPRLDQQFRLRLRRAGGYDAKQIKALSAITVGAAARMIRENSPPEALLEQINYSGRRLAKLNLSPRQALEALKVYDGVLEPALRKAPPADPRFAAARERYSFCVALGLNNAFHLVQRAEADAYYQLFQAELEAKNLDELLLQFLNNLTAVCQAQAGRLLLFRDGGGTCWAKAATGESGGDWQPPKVARRRLEQLSRTRYIRQGERAESLILDKAMAKLHRSFWSVPLVARGSLAGVIQLGFSTERSWLPRELHLLNGAVQQCLQAAEKARLVQDLGTREEQIRQLSEHMWQVEEEERRRISRELHDEAGQSLLFIRLQLEMLERVLPDEARGRLAEIRDVTERTIVEIRRIIAALSPSVLEQLGLVPALRQLTARFRRMHPVRVRLHVPLKLGRLPREAEIITYRLVQECYNNIAKHSAASTVNIYLRSTDRYLELRVEDDGVGFEVDSALKKRNSFGLSGMRERVTLLGGSLEIQSSRGRGTAVKVSLPLRGRKETRAKDASARTRT